MNTLVDWIAAHTLLLWVLLPWLAVLAGDLAWQRSPHRRMAVSRTCCRRIISAMSSPAMPAAWRG